MRAIALSALVALAIYPFSSLAESQTPNKPHVNIDNATVIGITDGTTNSFLGIPFAQPP